MNLVSKNIIANYVGKVWGFLSIFIFVRFYIELLGIESYGVINFYTVILGILVFADGGLTAALTRELARDISIEQKSNLVYTFERIYFLVFFIIIFLIFFFSENIASGFLSSKNFSVEYMAYLVKLMGVGVALQLFSTLYDGGLQGLQQQVLTNKIRIIWNFFKSGVVLIPLLFLPNLDIFFIWQIVCNLIVLLILRNKLVSYLPNSSPIFSVDLLRATSKYALSMMGIAFISAINIQIDKLVVSNYLTMQDFGYYSVASVLAQLPTIIIGPIIVAIFPLFSNFVSQSNQEEIILTFHKYAFLVTTIVASIVICLSLYTMSIIELWTGDVHLASSIENVVRALLLGGVFLCLQMVPFYLALAHGFTKLNLYSGIIGLFIVVPMMIYCIQKFGMIGATMPWIFINVATFFVIAFYVVCRFLPGQLKKWVVWDIIMPITVAVTVGMILHLALLDFGSKYVFVLKSMIIGMLSIVLSLVIYQKKFPQNLIIDFIKIKLFLKGKLKDEAIIKYFNCHKK